MFCKSNTASSLEQALESEAAQVWGSPSCRDERRAAPRSQQGLGSRTQPVRALSGGLNYPVLLGVISLNGFLEATV